VGALGGLLARESINISRMHVGVDGNGTSGGKAIALISISKPLPKDILAEVQALPAVAQAITFEL